jgi:hypothetical protein
MLALVLLPDRELNTLSHLSLELRPIPHCVHLYKANYPSVILTAGNFTRFFLSNKDMSLKHAYTSSGSLFSSMPWHSSRWLVLHR